MQRLLKFNTTHSERCLEVEGTRNGGKRIILGYIRRNPLRFHPFVLSNENIKHEELHEIVEKMNEIEQERMMKNE